MTMSVFCVRERPSVSSNRIRLILGENTTAKRDMSKNLFYFTQASICIQQSYVATYCARVSFIVSHVMDEDDVGFEEALEVAVEQQKYLLN